MHISCTINSFYLSIMDRSVAELSGLVSTCFGGGMLRSISLSSYLQFVGLQFMSKIERPIHNWHILVLCVATVWTQVLDAIRVKFTQN